MNSVLKRFGVLLLALILLMSSSGCGNRKNKKSAEDAPVPTVEAEEEQQPLQTPEIPSLVGGEEPSEKPESSEPTPTPEPENTVSPLAKNLFTVVNGEFLYMSITEEQFLEFADFFRRELNLHDAALAGLLSNLQGEAGFDPTRVGDGGDAFGICQWREARLEQLIAFCKEYELNPVSLEGQMKFLVYDLRENYILAYDLLRTVENNEQGAVQATYNFCAYYEVPADPEAVSRGREKMTKLLIYPALLEHRKDN